MRQIRHNADRDLRDLERQAAAGDPSAREELLAARLRAGVFHSAARVLIEDADGRLPIDVIHSLHAELMRYDLMEKLKVYSIVIRRHPFGGGIIETLWVFGT